MYAALFISKPKQLSLVSVSSAEYCGTHQPCLIIILFLTFLPRQQVPKLQSLPGLPTAPHAPPLLTAVPGTLAMHGYNLAALLQIVQAAAAFTVRPTCLPCFRGSSIP